MTFEDRTAVMLSQGPARAPGQPLEFIFPYSFRASEAKEEIFQELLSKRAANQCFLLFYVLCFSQSPSSRLVMQKPNTPLMSASLPLGIVVGNRSFLFTQVNFG